MIKINYKKYIGARDTSWRLIIDLGLTELPIDINKILKDIGIMAGKYSKNRETLKKRGLSELCNNSDAFTVVNGDKHYVFYDDRKSKERIRFTLAHELGHIILNHVKLNGQFTTRNMEPDDSDDEMEQEANIFASRLLSPACVLWGCGVKSSEEIAKLCEISKKSSDYRMIRMNELYKRNKFLTSSLEREVFKQFEIYINNNKL